MVAEDSMFMRFRGTLSMVLISAAGLALGQGKSMPLTATQEQTLVNIRVYALGYAKSLPDYACLRITRQRALIARTMLAAINHEGDEGTAGSRVVYERLIVFGHTETYEVLKMDGTFMTENAKRKVVGLHHGFEGTLSVSEFRDMLTRIFEPTAGASFRWMRLDHLNGRAVTVFSFHVPKAAGLSIYDAATESVTVASYDGVVMADAKTMAVLRIKVHSSDFPSDAESTSWGSFRSLDLTLDYRAAKIGGRELVMPESYLLQWGRYNPSSMDKLRVLAAGELTSQGEYKDYKPCCAEGVPDELRQRNSLHEGLTNDTDSAANSAEPSVHSLITFGEIVPPKE
jgi:hypothetical protein